MSLMRSKRIKETDMDTMTYLSKVEKKILEKKIKSTKDKLIFRNFIKENHSEEEINIMKNDLELNLNRLNEFHKLTISLAVPFFVVIFSFISATILFVSNVDFSLAIKAAEAKESYKQLNYNELIRYFGFVWFVVYISVFILAYLGISRLPRRRIMYLSILKTFK